MKFREKYQKTKDWRARSRIVSIYHSVKIANNKKWMLKDTAAFFHISLSATSEAISIVENGKLVEKCKSRNEALKLIRSSY